MSSGKDGNQSVHSPNQLLMIQQHHLQQQQQLQQHHLHQSQLAGFTINNNACQTTGYAQIIPGYEQLHYPQQATVYQTHSAIPSTPLINNCNLQGIQANMNMSNQYFNNDLNNRTLSWRDLLDSNYKIDLLETHIADIAREPKLTFTNEFKTKLGGNSKNNKNKVAQFRSDLFKIFLNKMKYTGNNIFNISKERSGIQMVEDIHTICCSYEEEIFKIELLDIFTGNDNKKDTGNEAVMTLLENETSINRSEMQRIDNVISGILRDLRDCKDQNRTLQEKLNTLESNFNVAKENHNNTDCLYQEIEKPTNSNKKRLRSDDDSSQLDQHINNQRVSIPVCTTEDNSNVQLISVPTQNIQQISQINSIRPILNDEGKTNNRSNANNNLRVNNASGTLKETPLKQVSYAQSVSNTTAAKSKQSLNNIPRYKQTEIIKSTVNGTTKIHFAQNKINEITNDGFTLVSNRRRNRSSKHTVIGSAKSEIKALRGVSKPFHYYVGQWGLAVNPECLRKYINTFAKVIAITELSTHVERRYFRSFKVTVESYNADDMLTSANWPGGVKVCRWWERNNNYRNQNTNAIVTSEKAISSRLIKNANNILSNEINIGKMTNPSRIDKVDLNTSPSVEEANSSQEKQTNQVSKDEICLINESISNELDDEQIEIDPNENNQMDNDNNQSIIN